MKLIDIIHPSDHFHFDSRIQFQSSGNVGFQTSIVTKRNSTFPADIQIRNIKMNDVNYKLLNIRDTSLDLEMEKKLTHTLLWYDSLFQYNLDIIFSLDQEALFTSINPTGEKKTGYSKKEILHTSFTRLVNEEDSEKVLLHFKKSLQGIPQKLELVIQSKTGESIELLISTVPIKDGEIVGVVGIAKDITERKEMERKLTESEQRYRSLFQYNPDAVISFDLQGKFVNVNPSSTIISGYTSEELSKMNFTEIIAKENQEETQFHFEKATKGGPQTYETSIYHKNGQIVFLKATNIPIWVNEEIVGVYGIVKDITMQKLAEDQIKYMAFHDPLTGLPNRRLFKKRLIQALEEAKDGQFSVGVMFIDLDRFKLINDTLGHNVGDLLLVEVSKRLESCLRNHDIISRRGGDEFTVLLSKITKLEAQKVAERIIYSLRNPFIIGQNELFITPSIGISIYPLHGKRVDSLLQKADIAMYKAKELGKNNYQLYSPKLNKESHDKLMIQNKLYKALEKNEFNLFYQPKIDLCSKKIMGVEALIRWQDPEIGMVSPTKFISIAEETGLILPIGKWVLREACRQNKNWQKQGYSPLTISVNLSTRQFYQQNLIPMISSVLKETELSPEFLEVEITESTTMDVELAAKILCELKKLGISISIVDFGTGYSSLYYLKKFPIDRLKIDQSFIRDIITNGCYKNIVTTIIDMAHHLGLKVIAEGVETKEQLESSKKTAAMKPKDT